MTLSTFVAPSPGDSAPIDPDGLIDYGIQHCRAGRWQEGAHLLRYVAERRKGPLGQAGLFLSYLGCAIARSEERHDEALALCRQAVELEFYQPEGWANLAEVLLLAGERREAAAAIQKGLRIDRAHPRLLELKSRMGVRRRPPVRFLSRSNPVNHLLGALRSQFRRTGGARSPESGGSKPAQ